MMPHFISVVVSPETMHDASLKITQNGWLKANFKLIHKLRCKLEYLVTDFLGHIFESSISGEMYTCMLVFSSLTVKLHSNTG